MMARMNPERLAEIDAMYERLSVGEARLVAPGVYEGDAWAAVRDLRAEVDRLTAELAEADTAHDNCADPVLVQNLRTEIERLTAERDAYIDGHTVAAWRVAGGEERK